MCVNPSLGGRWCACCELAGMPDGTVGVGEWGALVPLVGTAGRLREARLFAGVCGRQWMGWGGGRGAVAFRLDRSAGREAEVVQPGGGAGAVGGAAGPDCGVREGDGLSGAWRGAERLVWCGGPGMIVGCEEGAMA